MNTFTKMHAHAEEKFQNFAIADPSKVGISDLSSLANKFIDWLTLIAGILATIYLIYSGILYLTAAGNPDAAKKGQQGVVNAIIGIIVIVLARVIVKSVSSTVFKAGA